jgi:hypothetical protein
MSTCKELMNLGAAACKNPMQIAKRLIFVPDIGSDGTENMIATAGGVTKTALQALFNAAEKEDRFYPTPHLENVENARAETTFHEFNSGVKYAVKEGVKHFVGYIPVQHPQMLERLNAWEGQNFGIYVIDKDGNFIYQTDAATKLEVKPFQIYGNSFVATEVEPTDAEVPMIRIEFDYSIAAKDHLKRYIAESDLDFNALSTSDVYGLWDVTTVISSISTAGFTMTCTTEYGTAVTGITETDITLTDDSGSVGFEFASSGASGGVYPIEFDSVATSEDEITVTISKDRYDFGTIDTVEIP